MHARACSFAVVAAVLLALTTLAAAQQCCFPKPASFVTNPAPVPMAVDAEHFAVTIVSAPTEPSSAAALAVLQDAIARYTDASLPGGGSWLFPFGTTASSGGLAKRAAAGANVTLTGASISVANYTSSQPELYMNESYTLTIGADGGVAAITAESVWGALHALATLSQLIVSPLNGPQATLSTYTVPEAPLQIVDYPQYPWRGFLIDLSRHYLDLSAIYRQIDAMAWIKLNTLHLHAVDAESWPLESAALPLLSEKGAWAPSAIYTHDQLAGVVAYAGERGIRVILELDSPGHAAGWGMGYPNLTMWNCDTTNANNIPMNVINPAAPAAYRSIVDEFAPLFPDEYFHVGGDEVEAMCWIESEAVIDWCKQNGVNPNDANAVVAALVTLWFDSVLPALTQNNKTPVFWADILSYPYTPPSNAIIHAWENSQFSQALQSGYVALNSDGWYLDQQIPMEPTHYEWVDTWQSMYTVQLSSFAQNAQQLALILGGEGTMWGEQVNAVNIDSRVWPRIGAAAERLWTLDANVVSALEALPRLAQWQCRATQRGLGAGPIQPDYCPRPGNTGLPPTAARRRA